MSAAPVATIEPLPGAHLHPVTAGETRWNALRGGNRWRTRDVVWTAAACGLAAGWTEALFWIVKRYVLGQFTYVHDDILWMSPVAHLVLFVAIGLPLGWLVKRIGHPAAGTLAVLLLAMTSALCVLLLFPQIHLVAQLLLTIGAATQFARWCERHPVRARVAMRRTAACLALFAAIGEVTQTGLRMSTERRMLAAMPPISGTLPNVVLIVLDTMRADALGAYGAPGNPTPNLDGLAARGVLFENASSTASWTLPATASLMTGRRPSELSADWLTPLDKHHRTLAEALRSCGYATGGFVANYKYATAETGLARGFARYDSHSYSLAEFAACTAIGRTLFFSRVLPNFGCYSDPVRRSAAEINERYLAWSSRNGDRPHFAFLNYLDVHDPYAAPLSFVSRKPSGPDERSLLRFWWFLERDSLTASEGQLARDAYADCVRYLDAQIGSLVEALEAHGELDNTIIIVTADHGEHFGEHDLWLHGNSLYEPLVHVPLIVAAPGAVPAGRRVATPVSIGDVPATVTELLHVKQQSWPGESLASLWDDGPVSPRPVYSEVLSPPVCPPCQGASPIFRGSMRAVRSGDYKYIRNLDGGEELFDLAADPDELTNLVAVPAHQPDLERLRALLP